MDSMVSGVSDNGCPVFMSSNLMTCGRENKECLQVLFDVGNAPEKIISSTTTALSLRQTSHLPVMSNFHARNPACLVNIFSSAYRSKCINLHDCKQNITAV
jgi:hypothetical protein